MNPLIVSLIAMLAMQMLVSTAGGTAPVLIPAAASEFGVDPASVSIYVSVTYAFAALAVLMSGGFILRFGGVRTAQFCLVVSGLGVGIATLATPGWAIVSAVVLGIGLGPATPASAQLMLRHTPAHLMNVVFSIRQTGVPIGFALAGLILPSIAVAAGWRSAVAVVVAACFAAAVALQPLRAHFDAERDPTRPLLTLGHVTAPIRLVLGHPVVRRLLVLAFFYNGIQMCLAAYLVTYVTEQVGVSLVAAGLMASAAQTGGAIGRIVWGGLADYWRAPTRVLSALGPAAAVASVATALFTDSWPIVAMVAVSFLFGITSTGWNGVYLAQVAQRAPAGRIAETMSGTGSLSFAGVIVMPSVFGAVLSLSGSYAWAWVFVALFPLAVGIWIWLTVSEEALDRAPPATHSGPNERH